MSVGASPPRCCSRSARAWRRAPRSATQHGDRHVRVGVAIYSYDGGLGFGVTADDDTAPDVDVLCAGIERGMAEMLAAARGAHERERARLPSSA